MSRDWADKEGPLRGPHPDPRVELDRRVQRVLERLDPDAALVMRVQGRREFERMAEARQRRIDARKSSHDISAAMPVRDPMRLMGFPSRAERIAAANRPVDGQWPGRNHMTDTEHAAWIRDAWPDLDELLPQQRDHDDAQEHTR